MVSEQALYLSTSPKVSGVQTSIAGVGNLQPFEVCKRLDWIVPRQRRVAIVHHNSPGSPKLRCIADGIKDRKVKTISRYRGHMSLHQQLRISADVHGVQGLSPGIQRSHGIGIEVVSLKKQSVPVPAF